MGFNFVIEGRLVLIMPNLYLKELEMLNNNCDLVLHFASCVHDSALDLLILSTILLQMEFGILSCGITAVCLSQMLLSLLFSTFI